MINDLRSLDRLPLQLATLQQILLQVILLKILHRLRKLQLWLLFLICPLFSPFRGFFTCMRVQQVSFKLMLLLANLQVLWLFSTTVS